MRNGTKIGGKRRLEEIEMQNGIVNLRVGCEISVQTCLLPLPDGSSLIKRGDRKFSVAMFNVTLFFLIRSVIPWN